MTHVKVSESIAAPAAEVWGTFDVVGANEAQAQRMVRGLYRAGIVGVRKLLLGG